MSKKKLEKGRKGYFERTKSSGHIKASGKKLGSFQKKPRKE
jgi:hypothetical protein